MPTPTRLPQHPLTISMLFVFVHTMLQAQSAVQWVTVGGTSQLDYPGQPAFGHAGEIYLPGTFGYDGLTLAFEAVLYTYDLNGLQTRSQAWRGEEIEDLGVHTNGTYLMTGRVIDSDLLGVGLSQDFYLAAYAADGTLIWERTAGTTDSDRTYQKDGQPGLKLALDNGGNIYVAGRSIGPAVFGSRTFSNTPGGPLICKYSQDGTLLWVKRAEGKSLAPHGVELGGGAANGIVLDTNGNALVSGYMTKGEANFDGVGINVFGRYDTGAFIAKYSPLGQILWAKAVPFGETAMDGQGNVLISGPMTNGLANIGGVSVSIADPSVYHSFVAMLSPGGSLLWAKATPVGGLAVDIQGNVYCGASKFDAAGNLLWVRKITGASLNVATLNNREEPVFTGTIVGTVNFDGHTVQSDGDNYTDYVICKADRNGTFQWAVSVNSGNLALGFDEGPVRAFGRVKCDQTGNIFAFGTVNCPWSFPQQTRVCSVATFGDIPLSVQYGGNNDFFLARISDPAPPELKIKSVAAELVLSWPADVTGFVLESSTTFPASSWTLVNTAPVVQGNENIVSVSIEPGARFFRLRKS